MRNQLLQGTVSMLQQSTAAVWEALPVWASFSDEHGEDAEPPVSSRGFHEGKSQISISWPQHECGRMRGMCWSHVARAPDLTNSNPPTNPQPAQQPCCLKGLLTCKRWEQEVSVQILKVKSGPVTKNICLYFQHNGKLVVVKIHLKEATAHLCFPTLQPMLQ